MSYIKFKKHVFHIIIYSAIQYCSMSYIKFKLQKHVFHVIIYTAIHYCSMSYIKFKVQKHFFHVITHTTIHYCSCHILQPFLDHQKKNNVSFFYLRMHNKVLFKLHSNINSYLLQYKLYNISFSLRLTTLCMQNKKKRDYFETKYLLTD